VQDGWADDALWHGLRARDPRALEALIAQYAREIAYFVRNLLDGVGTLQDAEECVQDAFVVAWDEIADFDPRRGALRTWLTMRAKYLALDRRRQLQRRHAIVAPTLDSVHHDSAHGADGPDLASIQMAERSESLEKLLERREQQEDLRQALERLPELERLLVYLRYFRLKNIEEIAARTGLTRRAIDTRLWRARKVLRDALEDKPNRHLAPRPAQTRAQTAAQASGQDTPEAASQAAAKDTSGLN
jgi:RNA polymerase sigma-70 factor (ECF subfamily)